MRSRRLDDGIAAGTRVDTVAGVPMRDSAAAFLRFQRLMADESLTPNERWAVAKMLLFPEGASDDDASAALWEAFGVDVDGSHADECGGTSAAFDWVADAGRIRTSIRQQFGIDWDEVASTMRMTDVLDMLSALMESGSTPFQQAVYYRTARRPQNMSPDSARAWDERVRHFDFNSSADPYGDAFLRGVAENG